MHTYPCAAQPQTPYTTRHIWSPGFSKTTPVPQWPLVIASGATIHVQSGYSLPRLGTPATQRHLKAPGGHRFGAVGMWPLCGASSTLEVPEESYFPLSVPHLGQGIQEGGGESEALPALLAVLVEPCLSRGPPQLHGHPSVGEGQAPQSQDRRPQPLLQFLL